MSQINNDIEDTDSTKKLGTPRSQSASQKFKVFKQDSSESQKKPIILKKVNSNLEDQIKTIHDKEEEEKDSTNNQTKNAVSTSRSFSNTDRGKIEKANREDLRHFSKKAPQ